MIKIHIKFLQEVRHDFPRPSSSAARFSIFFFFRTLNFRKKSQAISCSRHTSGEVDNQYREFNVSDRPRAHLSLRCPVVLMKLSEILIFIGFSHEFYLSGFGCRQEGTTNLRKIWMMNDYYPGHDIVYTQPKPICFRFIAKDLCNIYGEGNQIYYPTIHTLAIVKICR